MMKAAFRLYIWRENPSSLLGSRTSTYNQSAQPEGA